jgi:TnpA family transposase
MSRALRDGLLLSLADLPMTPIAQRSARYLTGAGNFIRLERLREANERIANATARLPIFRHFDIGEAVRSSSDGQRFEAAIPTINARHSAKYFGQKKGVVA